MITGVAIKFNQLTICLPKPNRHHDVIRYMVNGFGFPAPITGEQGFYTDSGLFLTRTAAKRYAQKHNQLTQPTDSKYLFSEDLW